MITSEEKLVQEYLTLQKQFKLRRLAGVSIICIVLFVLFGAIYLNDWFAIVGDKSVGWVVAGGFVAVSAIGAVLLDLIWRKE